MLTERRVSVIFVPQVAGEDTDDENRWGGDAEDDEDTFFDMDEFVLQESTGYMLPALRFLAVFHTIISLLCLVGYYCLKVGRSSARPSAGTHVTMGGEH